MTALRVARVVAQLLCGMVTSTFGVIGLMGVYAGEIDVIGFPAMGAILASGVWTIAGAARREESGEQADDA